MINKTIIVKDANYLKDTIIKNGLSYRQLAKKIECSQTQISLVIKGERNPSPDMAVKICKELNKQFEDIFFIKTDFKSNHITS